MSASHDSTLGEWGPAIREGVIVEGGDLTGGTIKILRDPTDTLWHVFLFFADHTPGDLAYDDVIDELEEVDELLARLHLSVRWQDPTRQ